jgi:hypothetical protein
VKNEIERPTKVMTQGGSDCRVAALVREEVVVVVVAVGEEIGSGVELEDNGEDDDEGLAGVEVVPKSREVEMGLGCAVSTEDGAGITDVNSGIGE